MDTPRRRVNTLFRRIDTLIRCIDTHSTLTRRIDTPDGRVSTLTRRIETLIRRVNTSNTLCGDNSARQYASDARCPARPPFSTPLSILKRYPIGTPLYVQVVVLHELGTLPRTALGIRCVHAGALLPGLCRQPHARKSPAEAAGLRLACCLARPQSR